MQRLGVIPVPTGVWIYLGHAAFKAQAEVPVFDGEVVPSSKH